MSCGVDRVAHGLKGNMATVTRLLFKPLSAPPAALMAPDRKLHSEQWETVSLLVGFAEGTHTRTRARAAFCPSNNQPRCRRCEAEKSVYQ